MAKSDALVPLSNSWILDKPTMSDEAPKDYPVENWVLWGQVKTVANKTMRFIMYVNAAGDGNANFDVDGIKSSVALSSLNLTHVSDGVIRQWILTTPDYIVTFDAVSRGIPLWFGRVPSEMLNFTEGVFLGGFDDCITITVTITGLIDEVYSGYGVYEHSWLNANPYQPELDYVWFAFNNENYYGVIIESVNRLTNEIYVRSGRIGIVNGSAYQYDDFIYRDEGSLQPSWIKIADSYLFESFNMQYTFAKRPFLNFKIITPEITTNVNVVAEIVRPRPIQWQSQSQSLIIPFLALASLFLIST